MYLQEIFEVVIGLIFTWLVLSTATMQIQEWIADFLKWRANDLEKAIQGMFNDGSLTRLFYDHPLIRSLSEQKNNKSAKPSYIPANKFSTTLLSVIQGAQTEASLFLQSLYELPSQLKKIKSKEVKKQASSDLSRLFELARLSVSTEEGEAMENLMLASLEKEVTDFGEHYPELKEPVQKILKEVQKKKEQIDKLLQSLPEENNKSQDLNKVLKGTLALSVTNPELKLTLSSLFIGIEDMVPGSEDYLQALRSNIETWFNDAMDRLSGWYKRKAQLTAFIIGFLIAVLLNVDTINIANQLWREPVLRQAINANAAQILGQATGTNAPGITDMVLTLQDQLFNVTLPVGWNFESVNTVSASNCSFTPKPGSTFGILWNGVCERPVGAPSSTNGWAWTFTKLAGLFITGLATTQGSSFWFDILIKIVNVRSSGTKPA